GRFEIVQDQPVIVLDAAHNGASAAWLRETLAQVFPVAAPRVLVFGASADKDVAGMFSELLPGMDALVLTQADHPRATSMQELLDVAEQAGFTGQALCVSHVKDALAKALELAGQQGVVTVTGSLFIVGEARDLLGLTLGRAAYLNRPYEIS
ncbi:MAG: bifunctional folylpolyglutamate synthase/dihydrofolate synthase, partial [Anaerolineae bacterium]|nr:bifunctional folylpolyglutamate synthase/dihydrofolate synthase [Anaerolineae bacterium]